MSGLGIARCANYNATPRVRRMYGLKAILAKDAQRSVVACVIDEALLDDGCVVPPPPPPYLATRRRQMKICDLRPQRAKKTCDNRRHSIRTIWFWELRPTKDGRIMVQSRTIQMCQRGSFQSRDAVHQTCRVKSHRAGNRFRNRSRLYSSAGVI